VCSVPNNGIDQPARPWDGDACILDAICGPESRTRAIGTHGGSRRDAAGSPKCLGRTSHIEQSSGLFDAQAAVPPPGPIPYRVEDLTISKPCSAGGEGS
jgi:hypothetical protein